MSKSARIWLIVAALAILLGGVVFVGAMTKLDWDFIKLSTQNYETNSYVITEQFDDISIKASTADIEFLPSDDGEVKIVCYEQEKIKHSVTVSGGALVIEAVDTREWFDHIGINFGSAKISVYLPGGEYGKLTVKSSTSDLKVPENFSFEGIDTALSTGDVKISASATGTVKLKTTTGDICAEGISAGSLDISVSTGRVTATDIICSGDVRIEVSTGKSKLKNITCQNLFSDGDTGDITLEGVIASGKFDIERDTGDVNFERSDAAEIFVETDTGDVRGTLLSSKVFIAETDTGEKSVPSSTTGGRCEISTDTGDIVISIAP